jgi:hypothetical protein
MTTRATIAAKTLRSIAADEETAYLVLGCGASSTPAIQSADQDEENWIIARVIHAPALAQTAQRPDRWCVLVTGVEMSTLDQDRSVIAYRTINDFDLALGACRGVQPDDFASTELAMLAAGAIE